MHSSSNFSIVCRSVGNMGNEHRRRESRQTNNESVENENFVQLGRVIKNRAEEHRNIDESKLQESFEKSSECNRDLNDEEKREVRNLGITEHNLKSTEDSFMQALAGSGSSKIQNSNLVCHQTGGNK